MRRNRPSCPTLLGSANRSRFQSPCPKAPHPLTSSSSRASAAPLPTSWQAARPGITWDDLLRSADPVRLLRACFAGRRLRTTGPAATGVRPHCPSAPKTRGGDSPPEGDGGSDVTLRTLYQMGYRRFCPNCDEEDKDQLPSSAENSRTSASNRATPAASISKLLT